MTKAHGTLTRRPGGSCVSVSRVRRRPGHHSPNRSRRGGSHRSGASQVTSSPESGGGDAIPEGLRSRGSSRGCFQRGSPYEPLPPHVPGHCQPPRPRFDHRRLRQPVTYPCGGTEGLRVSQPEASPSPRLFRDSMRPEIPRLTTSRACEVFRRSILSPESWGGWFSCPSPARPCSEFQLVLATLGLILFPRRRRPLRPSRACRASQLTGYLIASG